MVNSAKPTCLIVDDDAEIRLLLRDFLAEKGYRVSEAHHCESAVHRLAETEYDLVLVDKNLPDGSGMDVVAEIRRLEHQSEIIIVTGYSDLDSALEAFRYGVYRYLKKPFELERLSIEIGGAMRVHTLNQHLRHRTAELETANVALQRSEARFRTLAELLPGIVFETDAAGRATFVNQTGLEATGYSQDTFRARFADASLFVETDRERWTGDVARALQGESLPATEYHIRCRDGTEMPVLAQVAPLGDPPSPGGLRAVLLDITTRKRAEEALREREAQLQLGHRLEAVGALAGGVAHDFNNILAIIRGFCDVILLQLDRGSPLRTDLEGIIDASDRAASLTRQLLAFGRKQVSLPQVFDLNDVLQATTKMLRRLLREDIALEMRPHAEPLLVYIDRGQLEQVIVNLAVNARDAMPDGGTLRIETALRHPGDGPALVTLAVTDSGVGMDEATLARAFEPYYTTKPMGRGTGLGLATVYGIVQQNGGSIGVESTPGLGSRFEVRLPWIDAELTAVAYVPLDVGALSGDETVLVVEDEDVLLDVVARILRSHGYSVLTAASGGDALLLSDAHPGAIDLVLVDVVMPRMSGPEAVSRIRERRPEVAALYMSGYSDLAAIRHVLEEGVDHFIPKPFSSVDLAEKVRDVLHLAR